MSAQTNIITITNNEPLVQFLLADEYEAYRERFPEEAIDVLVDRMWIKYSAETDDEWRDSYYESLHPAEFAEAVRRIQEYGEGKK